MPRYMKVKKRADAYTDLAETVKVVEKIAASRIHRLKSRITTLRTYMDEIEGVLADMLPFVSLADHPLFSGKKDPGQKVLIVLTGERGLVGGLYHSLINKMADRRADYDRLIVVGNRGVGYAREDGMTPDAWEGFPDDLGNDDIDVVSKKVVGMFTDGPVSKIDLLYPEFVSIAQQDAILTPFIPFVSRITGERTRKGPLGLPIFEPNPGLFAGALAEQYLRVAFTRFVMEAKLSELSARTVATEHASAKTEEILRDITLEYLDTRRRELSQAQIENFIGHERV